MSCVITHCVSPRRSRRLRLERSTETFRVQGFSFTVGIRHSALGQISPMRYEQQYH